MPRTTRDEARARIIEAAWDEVDAADLDQVLAGVSLREVARRAGVSASTVTYHFPERQELARAMVEYVLDHQEQIGVEVLNELLDATDSPRTAVRLAVDANWAVNVSEERRRLEVRAMRLLAGTGSVDGGATLRDLLAERYYGAYLTGLEALWDATVRRFGAAWVDPFTSRDLALATSAMIEGLTHLEMVGPGTVRPELASDVVIGLLSAVSRRDDQMVGLPEREIAIPNPAGPGPGSLLPGSDMLDAAARAAPLFQQRFEEVTWTEVAATVDRSVTDLATTFGTVRRVASVSFLTHLPALRDAASRRAAAGPEVALIDLLCEVARCARVRPGVARALMAERIVGAARAEGAAERSWTINDVVPLNELAGEVVRALPGVPDDDPESLAPTLVNLTLGRAVARPREAPARVAALAARLVTVADPDA